jgi:nicotinate-nucleotide adenylyltransferase
MTDKIRTGKIRTGFYGGSFNPLHEGHLALADYLCANKLVDECWFVVSPQNPLKKTADPADAAFRLKTVEEALVNHPGCTASDIEFSLPCPSYTVQTLRYAEQHYPNREFVLIIGGDNLDLFEKWKEYEFLRENYDIIVYPRPGYSNQVPEGWNRVKILNAPMMDISSTQIRQKSRC